MEYSIKNYNEQLLKQNFPSYVLGADVGGTHTNLAIAGINNYTPVLLFSLHFNTKDLNSLIPAIDTIQDYANKNYGIQIDTACIGAAGIVSNYNDFVKLTNVGWTVSSNEIIDKTSLKSVLILNDFQIIGYSVNLLNFNNSNDLFVVRGSEGNFNSNIQTRAIIGAGTGLGKSILNYDKHFKAYVPISSEGGHVDFPVQSDEEMELVNFVKKVKGISQPLNYEELISGRGIENIYSFLRQKQQYSDTRYTNEIDNSDSKAPLISKYKNEDEICKKTFSLFTKFYARCAKNFVLDTLALGGIYIAGGIAAKNKEIFTSKDFFDEFENAYRRSEIMKKIPISVIVNYDVSLIGACFAAMYNLKK